MKRTKKVKSTGRFRAGYGSKVKEKVLGVEVKQKQRQSCPFCKGRIKRLSKGIWKCSKCNKKLAGHTYYLN